MFSSPPHDDPCSLSPRPSEDDPTPRDPGVGSYDPRHVLELIRERDQWRRLSESEGRGFVVLAGSSRVHWAGRHARAMLGAYGLSLAQDRLPRALGDWLAPLVGGSATTLAPLRRYAGRRSLCIRVRPHEGPGAGVMLSVEEEIEPQTSPALDVERDVPVIAQGLGLTRRQAEVALWMSEGKSNPEIATILAIRTATVKKHAERIFAALGVENRTSAAGMIHQALARAPARAA